MECGEPFGSGLEQGTVFSTPAHELLQRGPNKL